VVKSVKDRQKAIEEHIYSQRERLRFKRSTDVIAGKGNLEELDAL